MANGYVSQVQLPNNETYDIKDKNAVKDITSSDISGNVSFVKGEETKDILVKDFGTAYGINCYKDKFPLDFTSPGGVIDEWKIYGNSSGPAEVIETQSTLPVGIDTYGGNAVDWEIYGNNNPVIETESNTLPIDILSSGGNAVDWVIYGNDDNGTENLVFTYLNSASIDPNGMVADNTVYDLAVAPVTSNETYSVLRNYTASGSCVYGFFTQQPTYNSTTYDGSRSIRSAVSFSFVAPIDGYIAFWSYKGTNRHQSTCVKGSTAPDHYIPYQKGVGERTAQLFDIETFLFTSGTSYYEYSDNDYINIKSPDGRPWPRDWYAPELEPGTYLLHWDAEGDVGNHRYRLSSENYGTEHIIVDNNSTIELSQQTQIKFKFGIEATYPCKMRIMLVKGSTAPTTYIPYGYQIPITVSQQGETDKNYDIYIGDTPLTEGQTITKTQSNVDLELFSGDNIIDTTLANKPQVDLTYRSSVLGVGEAVWIHGLSAPLRAIGDVKDTLDLSTGTLTRRIKKLVLTGTISDGSTGITAQRIIYITPISTLRNIRIAYCTHYQNVEQSQSGNMPSNSFTTTGGAGSSLWFKTDYTTIADFQSYLAAQYAAGTPVTVWYVLAEPEASTIPVPSGLTGTIEGYLIQDGTPTPETPIYPTANGEEDTGGTYKVFYSYQIPISVTSGQQSTPHTIYIGSAPLTEGQSISKTSTGTEIALYQGENTISTTLGNKPEMKIDYLSTEVGVGERTKNLFDIVQWLKNSTCYSCTMTSTPTSFTLTSTAFDYRIGWAYRAPHTVVYGVRATYVQVEENQTYTLTVKPCPKCYITFVDSSNEVLNSDFIRLPITNEREDYTFTTPTGCAYILLRLGNEGTAGSTTTFSDIMLVKGSTPPETYIPYGYQIPIDIKQGDEVVDHKDIYIGTQPLVEGDYINQTGVYRRLQQFVNYVDSTALPEFNFIPITEQLIAGNGENTITTSLVNNTTIDVELHPTEQASWICDKLEGLQRRIDNVDSTLGAPERRNYLVTWCSEDRLTGSTANLDFSFNNKDNGYSTFLIDGKSTATSAFIETINLLQMINGTAQAGAYNYTVARPGKYVVVIFGVEMEDSSSNTITLKIIRDNVVIASQQLINEYVGCIPFEIPNDLYGNNTIIQIEVNSTIGWTDLSFGVGIAVLNATMLLQDGNLKTDTMAIGNFSMYDSYIQLLRSHRDLEGKCTTLENKCTTLENEYDQLANESVKDITIYSDYTSTIPSGLNIDISQYKNKIKYIDIYFTDNNYRKGEVYPYNILAENFGYLRVPYGQIYTGASADEATRLSLSLIGDENSYYIRRELFYVSTDYEQEHLFFSHYSSVPGLIFQFVGTPTNDWSDFSVKGKASEVIKIYEVHLIVSP